MSTTIPAGSTVLVTGANGYIASHVADQLLARGYHVRGTVRSAAKGDATKATLDARHPTGPATFSYVVVEDMGQPDAFRDAIPGCAGICHVAANLSFSPDPHAVITPTLAALRGLVDAAAAAADVRRIVLTSTICATADLPGPGHPGELLTGASENTTSLTHAWADAPADPARQPYWVYAASKLASERLLRDLVAQHPGLVANIVVPGFTCGAVLDRAEQRSSARTLRRLFATPTDATTLAFMTMSQPQFQVDVQDVARLHVGALVLEDVRGAKLLALAHKFNRNSWFAAFRAVAPERAWPADDAAMRDTLAEVDAAESVAVLKRLGREGWEPFEASVRRCVLGD